MLRLWCASKINKLNKKVNNPKKSTASFRIQTKSQKQDDCIAATKQNHINVFVQFEKKTLRKESKIKCVKYK